MYDLMYDQGWVLAKVTVVANRDSFAHFGRNPSGDSSSVLEIRSSNGNTWWLSVAADASVGPNEIGLNQRFARELGFQGGDQVTFRFVPEVNPVQRLWVEPVDENDWELLESNESRLELELLNQLRIVHCGLRPVIFVGNLPLSIVITKVEPGMETYGRLEQYSEVYIQPKKRIHVVARLPASVAEKDHDRNLFGPGSWRIVPLPQRHDNHIICCYAYNSKSVTKVVKIRKLPFEGQQSSEEWMYLKLHLSDQNYLNKERHFFMPSALMKSCDFRLGDRVVIQQSDNDLQKLKNGQLVITTASSCQESKLKIATKLTLNCDDQEVFTNGVVYKFPGFSLQAKCKGNYSVVLDEASLESAQWNFQASDDEDETEIDDVVLDETQEVIKLLDKNLNADKFSCILICGENGSGKTFGLKQISSHLRATHYVYTAFINLRPLVGKRII